MPMRSCGKALIDTKNNRTYYGKEMLTLMTDAIISHEGGAMVANVVIEEIIDRRSPNGLQCNKVLMYSLCPRNTHVRL